MKEIPKIPDTCANKGNAELAVAAASAQKKRGDGVSPGINQLICWLNWSERGKQHQRGQLVAISRRPFIGVTREHFMVKLQLHVLFHQIGTTHHH